MIYKTHLIMKESLLHPIVSANLLENIPGKFTVELIGNTAHGNRDNANDSRYGNQERLRLLPHTLVTRVLLDGASIEKPLQRPVNLIDLKNCVNEKSKISQAQPDNLNGVLSSQRVPGKDEDVEEAENEEGQESRNRLVLRPQGLIRELIFLHIQTELETGKDISVRVFMVSERCLGTPCCRLVMCTYNSNATQITAWRTTTKKKAFAHVFDRNSDENNLGLTPLGGWAARTSILLSRYPLFDPSKLEMTWEPEPPK